MLATNRDIPQTELHRHLEGSLRPKTLLELAQANGLIPQSTSLESFKSDFLVKTPQKDLRAVLARFSLFQKVLVDPETLERVAFEAVEDCFKEGTRIAELRYAPHFVSEFSKLSFELTLSSFEAGIARALRTVCSTSQDHPMQVGLICILARDFGPESADEGMDFYIANRTRFVGVDLAGNEDEFPCRKFESAFKKLRKIEPQSNITIHSGEGSGPENVWEALDLLGAKRIGHGIRSIEDPQLLKKLVQEKICLEVCPSSNVITSTVESLEKHPLKKFISLGIPCSINTDDPGIFDNTLGGEFKIAIEKMGLTESDLLTCKMSAWTHRFVTDSI